MKGAGHLHIGVALAGGARAIAQHRLRLPSGGGMRNRVVRMDDLDAEILDQRDEFVGGVQGVVRMPEQRVFTLIDGVK